MKKQIIAIVILSLTLWGASYYFATSCPTNNSDCINTRDPIATPFFIGMPALFLVSLVLLFTSDSTYLAWRKFAVWAIPISAFILFLVPASSGGGIGISGPDLTKETASWGVAILFLIISLGIIAKQSLSRPTAK